MSAPRGGRSGSGIGPAVARRHQAQIGEPEIEHGARGLADILAELGADQDDDGLLGHDRRGCALATPRCQRSR